jgi:ATP phosphoribosyltransferase regulatory subunit
MSTWLLPENIADVLPAEARKIEELRRRLLERFRVYGYEMVMPPMLEYLESLLTSGGRDLNLRTFKLVDQMSGRTLGLRADITPQVARIDAHLLNRQGVTRLCYAGVVLHTRPRGPHATREQLQLGAEIYGHAGLEADLEIQQLMLDALHLAGLTHVRLDLSHAGVLAALIDADPAAATPGDALCEALDGKDACALAALTEHLSPTVRDALRALPTLYGDASVLELAREKLPALPGIVRSLDELAFLVAHIKNAEVTIDLAELGGYAYHSGVMFSAYVDGVPSAVVRGGRYDHVGQAYGRARAATGFSLDLREVARISSLQMQDSAILAPWHDDDALRAKIAALRAAGEVVIQMLPGDERNQHESACNRTLVARDGAWVVQAMQ